jgi:cytochrome oxidase assembly protein ShyY1
MIPHSLRRQRGLTMIGLLFWAAFIGFFGYLAVRTLPTVNEYLTIQKAITAIAASPPPTVAEIRGAFDRQRQIEYSIVSIEGKDLEISKENDMVVISFAYDKEVPIMGPVYLLVKYEGSSR